MAIYIRVVRIRIVVHICNSSHLIDEVQTIRDRVIRSITIRLTEVEYDYGQPELFSSVRV